MADCTKKKGCKAHVHWAACPEYRRSHNDDATYNRSNLTIDDAIAMGWYEYLPSERGDSMG